MRRSNRGGTIGKYLLLLFLVALLVALYVFKSYNGVIGQVSHIDKSTKDYIAYIRESGGKSDLYIVRADGTDAQKLTADGKGKRSPSWSPDGKKLCYAAEVSEDRSVAYQVFILGNGDPKQATYGSTSKDRPQYSPDGKWIAYLSGGCIKIVQPNGGEGRQVFPPPSHVGAPGEEADSHDETQEGQRKPPIRQFSWSPNSQGVAGVLEIEGEYAVAVGSSNWWQKDRKEPQQQTVTDPEMAVVLPSIDGKTTLDLVGGDLVSCGWVPNSRAVVLAFRREREGISAILLQGVDVKGMSPDALVVGKKQAGLIFEHPVVSPDGNSVAFIVLKAVGVNRQTLGIAVAPVRSGAPLVLTAPADVSKLKMVVKGDARSPQWSRDGTRLVYQAPGPTGKGDIWVCKADGSGAVNLTKGDGDCSDAAWSPAQ